MNADKVKNMKHALALIKSPNTNQNQNKKLSIGNYLLFIAKGRRLLISPPPLPPPSVKFLHILTNNDWRNLLLNFAYYRNIIYYSDYMYNINRIDGNVKMVDQLPE